MLNKLLRLSQARILVVDDSEFTQRLIVGALSKAGFTKIEVAKDGVDALEKTYRLRPDLVILDLNMPNLDGFGYCEQVRNDGDLPRFPIIVQTMIEERETKLRALSCGADDFLPKPLDMEELNLRIRIHLEHYFSLQDMRLMCDYLKMEMEQTKELLSHAKSAGLSDDLSHRLMRHHEVLASLTMLPSISEA